MVENRKVIIRFLIGFVCLAIVFNLIRIIFKTGEKEVNILGAKRVGLIYITGAIYSSKTILENLKKYGKDNTIKAIVLRIDSPGGGVAVIQEIFNEIKKVKTECKKFVIVSFGSVAASGGYYIGCIGDKIFSNPGTLVGSIGVIMESLNFEELGNKIGIKMDVVKSGKYKDTGNPMRKLTTEERQLLQETIDDVHMQFVDAIVEGRERVLKDKLKEEYGKSATKEDVKNEVLKISDGRVFSGKQAREIGLLDEIGTLDDAIKYAAKISGIQGEPGIVTQKKKKSFLDFLVGEDTVEEMHQKASFRGFSYIYHE